MNILTVIFYCSFATVFLSIPFLLFDLIKYASANERTSKTFPTKSLCFFVIPIVIVAVIGSVSSFVARKEALSFMRELPADYTIYVNGKSVGDGDRIISALKEVSPQIGHHSHPTKRIEVEIESNSEKLVLELRRDSEIPQEYWVSDLKYRTGIELGHIKTSVFDQY